MSTERIIDAKHNNPPPDAEILAQVLEERYELEIGMVNNLASRELPAEVNDVTAGPISDYIKAIASLASDLSEIHKREKEPHLSCGRAVDAFKNKYTSALETAKARAQALLTAHLRRKDEEERERIRQKAEAERLEAEACAKEAQAHAAEGIQETAEELMSHAEHHDGRAAMLDRYADQATPSQLTKTRGAGSVSSLKRPWIGEIEDISSVDLEALRPYLSLEAVQKAVNAFVKNGGRKLSGVKIEQGYGLSNR